MQLAKGGSPTDLQWRLWGVWKDHPEKIRGESFLQRDRESRRADCRIQNHLREIPVALQETKNKHRPWREWWDVQPFTFAHGSSQILEFVTWTLRYAILVSEENRCQKFAPPSDRWSMCIPNVFGLLKWPLWCLTEPGTVPYPDPSATYH